MEDLYLKHHKNNKGCLRLIIVAAIFVLALGLWFFLSRSKNTERAEDSAQQEQQLTDEEFLSQTDTEFTAVDSIAITPGTGTETAPPPAEEPEELPVVTGVDPGPELLRDAEAAYAEKEYPVVRDIGLRIMDQSADPAVRRRTEELLGDVNIKMVFAPYPMPEKIDYTIKSGDTLGALAHRNGTTVDLIRKGNNISGSLIRVGDRYRILNGKFSIVVDKSDNDLVLKLNDRFFKRYRVGTGKYARTPVGDFKITDRVAQPTWWRPDGKRVPFGDKDNLLGTHWLSLDIKGYGIHGTWEPETIGHQASAGCVRMLNENVEELYTLVPIGTPVTITE